MAPIQNTGEKILKRTLPSDQVLSKGVNRMCFDRLLRTDIISKAHKLGCSIFNLKLVHRGIFLMRIVPDFVRFKKLLVYFCQRTSTHSIFDVLLYK